MRPRPTTRAVLGTAAVAVLLAGCGATDAEGEVRNLGSEAESGSSTGSGTGSEASGSGSEASASGVAGGCSPVNPQLEADAVTTVEVALRDYEFVPSEIEVPAGVVTFATSNEGEEGHEFAVLPGGGDVPLTEDGAPDEEALEAAGAFELEAYAPGEECNATWELDPGVYTVFCIVEAADGETHAEKGMVGTLTVTE